MGFPKRGLWAPPPDRKPLSPYAPSRPLRHIQAFRCANWSPALADALDVALSTLPAAIKELGDVGAFHHGPDMGLCAAGHNMDYSITADFADTAAYAAFCSHP